MLHAPSSPPPSPDLTASPLGLAVALYAERGLSEVEALRALHVSVRTRAETLLLRLDGELE